MKKADLILALCDIENKALHFANKSFVCGTHNNVTDVEYYQSKKEMSDADADLSVTIKKLRDTIISEGVSE